MRGAIGLGEDDGGLGLMGKFRVDGLGIYISGLLDGNFNGYSGCSFGVNTFTLVLDTLIYIEIVSNIEHVFISFTNVYKGHEEILVCSRLS